MADGFRVLEAERRAGAGSSNGQAAIPGEADAIVAAEEARARKRSRETLERQQRSREELMSIMRERFIAGDDAQFYDYGRMCDENADYDDVEQQARDAEERWFDAD